MEVILLERASNLGNVGDLVKVRNGYARNYLLPLKKALRATEENKQEFEARRAHIEKENAEKKKAADKLAVKVEGQFVILIRQAGEDGRLYGSVSARDISAAASEVSSIEIKRGQVAQFNPIKALGVHTVKIDLHPEVSVSVHVTVARSNDEAEIAKKEFLSPAKKKADAEEAAAEASNENAAAEAEGETAEGKHKKKKKKVAKVVDIDLNEEEESAAKA